MRFDATIVQLLRADALKPGLWPAVIHRLAEFGVRALILQWTSAEGTDFYAGRPGASEVLPVLPELIGMAHRAGMRIWIGLHHDPGWWSAGGLGHLELRPFLDARVRSLEARLPYLLAAVDHMPRDAVAGWYVTEELDDRTWRTPEREAALIQFLGAVAGRLREVAPGRPIAISGFANGAEGVAEYAGQLRRVADAVGLDRLLLQDGIGAGKCSLDDARVLGQAVAGALRGGRTRFGMIVELFELAGAGGTEPASLGAILARMEATAGLAELPATSFSHAHHLTLLGGSEAAQRGAQFLAMSQRCRRLRSVTRADEVTDKPVDPSLLTGKS